MFGSKPLIGLDIGSEKVKAVQLRKRGATIEMERLGIADVYPGGDRSAASADARTLKIQAVRRALEDGKITAKHCVSAVSGESIIVRYIQLPQMPEQELQNALRWEAEEYIPFQLDEVYLDSVVLGSTGDGKVDVLLVCAKRETVNDHLAIIRAVGLTPLVVDVDSFAFLNAFEAAYSPGPGDCVALVNIGADTTNINVYHGGTSRFSRDIAVAGASITQAIAQKSRVAWTRADELKRTVGAPAPVSAEAGDDEESALINSIRGTVERMTGGELGGEGMEGGTSKVIRNVLTTLINEVRRSIQFFENQSGGATVQRILLGGGTASMPHLPEHLGSELELEVEVFDPLRGSQVGGEVDPSLLQPNRAHLGVGVGLALRKVMER